VIFVFKKSTADELHNTTHYITCNHTQKLSIPSKRGVFMCLKSANYFQVVYIFILTFDLKCLLHIMCGMHI